MRREIVGYCGVDSGLIYIVDPCYIRHHKELYQDDKWSDFCNSLREEYRVYDVKTKQTKVRYKDIIPCELYDGVVTHTAHGDGSYPVIATFDNEDRVLKMEIIFEYEDEDPEDVIGNFQNVD